MTELYDLESDPRQLTNVANEHPALVASLCAAYEKWWQLGSKQFHLDTPFVLDGESHETVSLHMTFETMREARHGTNSTFDMPWP